MIKLALPTGDLRSPAAEVLESLGLNVEGYGEGSRQYRLNVAGQEDVLVRVFRERDIPMQVALGNYDLGITGLAWIRELQARFPQRLLVPLADLKIGQSALFAATAGGASIGSFYPARIATEYPNLAEAFARSARLPRYRVQAVHGAADAYPPEDADIVIVVAADEAALQETGIEPVHHLLDTSAWLVANAQSLAGKDMTAVLSRMQEAAVGTGNGALRLPSPVRGNGARPAAREPRTVLRLAIPDGHQQRHVYGALLKAGLTFEGYEEKTYVRRPRSPIDGLEVKVIRPQDMPQLVALGEFDVAITGRDLLNEHLFQFPSSPVHEVVDLQVSQYNISCVVDGNLPAEDLAGAVEYWRSQGKRSLTVAAEFPATADHYARSRHFWRYQVIPIAGASEGFVPEDAEMLIEGTETGRTIAENNLKVIEHIDRSTTAFIARSDAVLEGKRREVYEELRGALAASVEQGSRSREQGS